MGDGPSFMNSSSSIFSMAVELLGETRLDPKTLDLAVVDAHCPKSGWALPEQGRKDHSVEMAVELLGETRLDPKTLDLALVDQATSK